MEAVRLSTFPHCRDAIRYAKHVINGKVIACKWVKACAQRMLDDLKRTNDPSWPFMLDLEKAEQRCNFVELLPHVKGAQWAGTHIQLEPWQKFAIVNVYGFVHKTTGLRRFRSAYLEVARKNAKSSLLGALCLSALTIDNELGGEVYTCATTRDQAKLVFGIARKMALMEPEFRATFGVKVFENALSVDSTGARMIALSAEGSTLDGLNVHFACLDELHANKTRTVHDVIDSAMGSRSQPLIFKITTAGSDRAGVCYDERLYLTKILNATLKKHGGMGYKVEGNCADDETTWGVIYTIDAGEEKDPFREDIWLKANPNLDISVDIEDMRRMAMKARTQSAALGEFLTKRLCVWVGAYSGWMNILEWDACGDAALHEDQFVGEKCWIGLDAGFKKDLFAKVKVFTRELPDGLHYYIFGRYYSHKAMAEIEGNEQLAGWAKDGWIHLSEGNVTDIADVTRELIGEVEGAEIKTVADLQRFELAEVGFDPAQIQPFASDMIDQGLPMVEVRPLVLHFSPPMKEIEELITCRRFHHNGDPVLAWMIANVVARRDQKDNIYPTKERQENKIDGAIALIIAMSRALLSRPDAPSYYEELAKAARAALPPEDMGEVVEVDEAPKPLPVVNVLSYWEQVAAERLQRERAAETSELGD